MISTADRSPVDLRAEQWVLLASLLPKPQVPGCMIPKEFGNGHTLYGYFSRWCRDSVWKRLMDTLHHWECHCQGRLLEPSAGWAESQSSKTATQGQDVGFGGRKK
jgi:hypothetical protein